MAIIDKCHTFGHAHYVCLHGGSSMTGGGSKMKCKLQKHVYESISCNYLYKKKSHCYRLFPNCYTSLQINWYTITSNI